MPFVRSTEVITFKEFFIGAQTFGNQQFFTLGEMKGAIVGFAFNSNDLTQGGKVVSLLCRKGNFSCDGALLYQRFWLTFEINGLFTVEKGVVNLIGGNWLFVYYGVFEMM